MKCEYAGCPNSAEPMGGQMRLCYNHELEFSHAVRNGPADILAFWIRARGGADELAKLICENKFGGKGLGEVFQGPNTE